MNDERIQSLANHIATKILRQPGKKIQPDQAIISSGLIDSFSLVDLALFIEDEYGAHLDDSELTADHFDNLIELDRLIESRLA